MLHSAIITKPKRNVFAVLDVGTTKMACLVVRTNNHGDYQIIGIGYKVSEGINGGAIVNMKRASHSILSTIDVAEQVSGETIDQVYLNISGCGVSSLNLSNEIVSSTHEISDRDIKRIVSQTYEKCSGQDVILHNIPIKYALDDVDNITELKGLYGSRLRADMHVVTGSRAALMNLEHCITSCNLNMAGCVAESYASGFSCLTADEKELGAIIIDIGGGHTSIGVFDKGKLVYADYITLGGVHITRDIAYGLGTSVAEAERIKILYGNIILTSADENGYIEVTPSTDNLTEDVVHVSQSELVNIIRPRIEEILEIIKAKLERQRNVTRKVVITGGSSQLASMKELAGYILDRQVRIGLPIDVAGIEAEYGRNPIFSAAIGVAALIVESFRNDGFVAEENGVRKFLSWINSSIRF